GSAKNGSWRRSTFHPLRDRRWRFSQKPIKTEPNRRSMHVPRPSRFLPSNHWLREIHKHPPHCSLRSCVRAAPRAKGSLLFAKLSAYAMAMRKPHGVTDNHFAEKLSKVNAER